jgi:hypothetical protein
MDITDFRGLRAIGTPSEVALHRSKTLISRLFKQPLRRVVMKGLSAEDGELDEALDIESLAERYARDNRRLGRRLSWLLIWLLFDVSHIKAHTTNLLGMQKGMTEDMLKDIFTDADRHTKTKLARKNPELTGFVDAIEQWLSAEEEDPKASGGGTNGTRGRGGPSA